MIPRSSQPTLLLVEDSDEDYETALRTFKKLGRPLTIWRCADGDDALDLLYRRGAHANRTDQPSLILLDLNLPATDGREVLSLIKHDAALKSIPVVILTTSANAQDVAACYANGASGYLLKPVDLEHFAQVLKDVYDYWFGAVLLPHGA
ncbi:MAG TPA: response regulator [Herpetosiphonaceae bacterium]|nr:response regulator [Herpetosiphonaceae bacterium]